MSIIVLGLIFFLIPGYGIPVPIEEQVPVQDTLMVKYSDFGTYKKSNSTLSFFFNDSLSSFYFTGNSASILYDDNSFKSNNIFDSRYSYKYGVFQFGSRLKGDFVVNEIVTRPTQNNISFLGDLGYRQDYFNSAISAGYVNRKDESSNSNGIKLIFDSDFEKKIDKGQFWSGRLDFEGDDLDAENNYDSRLSLNYRDVLDNGAGNYFFSSGYNLEQYHYYDTELSLNKIDKNEYYFRSVFFYNISDYLDSESSFSYFQRNKKGFDADSLNSKNEIIGIGFSNEFFYNYSDYYSSLKFDYKNGGEKFSISTNEDNYSDYTFQLFLKNKYFFNNAEYSLDMKYYKYEYKSLNEINTEDRDIIQIGLFPGIDYNYKDFFFIKQQLPLEYYHQVNISAAKSGNNFEDWIIRGITDYGININKDFRIIGNVNLKSFYHVYDFDNDSINIKSFMIKDFTFSDTLEYDLTKNYMLKYAIRYTFEEFSSLKWSEFKEDPVNYKNYTYNSLGMAYIDDKKFKFLLEYFFYEIDHYDYDLNNFKKANLRDVYITHGPKLTAEYDWNRLKVELECKYNIYRDSKDNISLTIYGGYSLR